MEHSKLLLSTYDSTLTALKITPLGSQTRVSYQLELYDSVLKRPVLKTFYFHEVIAIAFHMNYFDAPMGSEVFGFYEVFDFAEKQAMLERNFIARKEGFLFHNKYHYDANDESDLLNNRNTFDEVQKNLGLYRLFQQQTMGGIYLLLAKDWHTI